MEPFLKKIAALFYEKYEADIHRLAFVFPNRRSGLFFRKHLSEISAKPIFSPTTLTINELFQKISGRQLADKITLLFMLYDIYLQKSDQSETFDDFAYWGEMLLNDFDDVDKYLIDARQLFTNVTDLNHIERDFGYLTTEQIRAIRLFWSSFQPGGNDRNQQFFLRIWDILYPIYQELHKRLSTRNLAYEGMIYREVVENLERTDFCRGYEKIIFVGLNALTTAERNLLSHLNNKGLADFYWDYASEKIHDANNRASYFMRDNISMFPSEYELVEEKTDETKFEVIGVPSRIGQAKMLHPILTKLCDNKLMDFGNAMQTAIVLPDEQMFIPVLHSIPGQIKHINVTLGYSLSETSVASLMATLQSLQKNIRQADGAALFYHRDAIAILRHQYVAAICPEETSQLVNEIQAHNQIYIPRESFGHAPLLQLLFSIPQSPSELSNYLKAVLTALSAHIDTLSMPKEMEEEPDVMDSTSLDREFLYHYYMIVNRMGDIINETRIKMSIDTYFRLLKQMLDFIKIPFKGEPLSGLQVMGVLETRALDFDNVIILSMNEGVFPAKNTANSFIPYHLRRGFGLPTQEHQESIWAYYFYRLIHRAKRVIMLYDTRTDGLQSGEVSRFVHQLHYHYHTPICQKLSVYDVSSSHIMPFYVEKDAEVMKALSSFEKDKALSASALNIYIDCPLKFYFSVVKGIEEENKVSERLEHDTFGTILHRVMELIYKPLCGRIVHADILRDIAKERNLTAIIQEAFAKDFFHTDKPNPLVGQAYLYGETVRKYVKGILQYDQLLPPFEYIGSEILIKGTFRLGSGRTIQLKGFIDRVDKIGNDLRIVDYKSGKEQPLTFESVESLFDGNEKERKKAIMQVLFYSKLYSDNQDADMNIQPAVYYVRSLFGQTSFDPSIYHIGENGKHLVGYDAILRERFEEHLCRCINEVFDARTPFVQTPNTKKCNHCPFSGLCGK